LADTDPNTGTVTPDNPPFGDGNVVFAFSEMLDGTTISTANPQLLAGQPIRLGQGDWQGAFEQILSYTALTGVVAYVATSSPIVTIDNSQVVPSYRPDGGWQIDPALTIDKAPPPAIVVTPNGGSFNSGDTVIVHLLAVVKGISGVLIDQAVNANGDPVFLSTVPNSPPLPVAATVVFTVP
jgi:hypothetical protein